LGEEYVNIYVIYKALTKPVLMYGAETWVVNEADDLCLGVFKRKMLRRIYVPICQGVTWRSRYNEELYRLYDETDFITVRMTRLKWAGHIVRMQDNLPFSVNKNPTRCNSMQIFIYCKVTLHVSGVTAPIIRSTKNCTEAAVTVFNTPDDGFCDTRNM